MLNVVIVPRKLEKPVVQKAPAGAFCYLGGDDVAKKEFLTVEQQMDFLEKEKDLIITDRDFAQERLRRVGYFSLINGYKELFKEQNSSRFRKSVTFADICDLYEFDAQLRMLFLEHILIIEKTIKSSMAYHFCALFGAGQGAYLDQDHYEVHEKDQARFQMLVRIMRGQCRMDSDYAYIRHYMKKHGYVPLWVLINTLTLGQVSKLYAFQKGRVKVRICQDFGSIRIDELRSMLSVMTKFRNVCAHGERMYNYHTRDAIVDMEIHRLLQIERVRGRLVCGKDDLFSQVIVMKVLLPESDFASFFDALTALIQKNPISELALPHMGFPENWRVLSEI